jgi:hypothetical protein
VCSHPSNGTTVVFFDIPWDMGLLRISTRATIRLYSDLSKSLERVFPYHPKGDIFGFPVAGIPRILTAAPIRNFRERRIFLDRGFGTET